jgi:hypothetical protein
MDEITEIPINNSLLVRDSCARSFFPEVLCPGWDGLGGGGEKFPSATSVVWRWKLQKFLCRARGVSPINRTDRAKNSLTQLTS